MSCIYTKYWVESSKEAKDFREQEIFSTKVVVGDKRTMFQMRLVNLYPKAQVSLSHLGSFEDSNTISGSINAGQSAVRGF